jgi:CHRD domain
MSSRIRIAVLGAVVATCAVLALPASAANTALEARMNGDKEVPGPGDPNGRGVAALTVNPERNRVCFEITFRRIEDPFVGHIHKGRRGVANPPKVDLFEDAQGADSPIEDCKRNQPTRLLRKIKNHPSRWYVNLHNTEFPDGAIRGQLRIDNGGGGANRNGGGGNGGGGSPY